MRSAARGTVEGGASTGGVERSTRATGNRLLECLPAEDRRKVQACCQVATLRQGEELHPQQRPIRQVYFPLSGVCSIVVSMADARVVEAGTIGNEGVVGLQAHLGLELSLTSTVVQVPGTSLRMSLDAFHELARPASKLDALLRRYVAYTLCQANQAIACNALHSMEERACRWLLMTRDRAGSDDFTVTHELLAGLLGTHRQTVSLIAATLQRAGFIRYHRGSVRVLDRRGLEQAACECYSVSRHLYDCLMRCP